MNSTRRGRSWTRRAHRRAAAVSIAACLGLALGLTACGGGSDEPSAKVSDVLRWAGADPRCSINPSGGPGAPVPTYGYAELLTRARSNGQGVEPWLLKSFESTAPREWSFELRDAIKFHNGKAADAKAVVASLKDRGKEAFGPDAINAGKLAVTGPLTFTLTTKTPVLDVPNVLADPFLYYVYDVAARKRAGKDDQKLADAGIYTGPYKPVTVTAQETVATRFAGYWGKRPPLREVRVKCVSDPQARVSAIRRGEVDIAVAPPGEASATVEGSDVAYVRSRASGAALLNFNVKQAPLDDPAVRRAFALGVDYEALVKEAGEGRFAVATSLYAADLPWALKTQKTDIEQAKRLLDEAGWKASDGGARSKAGKPLRVVYLWSSLADVDHKTLGLVLREQLKPLGFDVQVRETENSYDPSSFPKGWGASAVNVNIEGRGNNPQAQLGESFGSGGGSNTGAVSDKTLDGLIAKLRVTEEGDARNELLRSAQQRIADRAYGFTMAFQPADALVTRAYREFRPDPKSIDITVELEPKG